MFPHPEWKKFGSEAGRVLKMLKLKLMVLSLAFNIKRAVLPFQDARTEGRTGIKIELKRVVILNSKLN